MVKMTQRAGGGPKSLHFQEAPRWCWIAAVCRTSAIVKGEITFPETTQFVPCGKNKRPHLKKKKGCKSFERKCVYYQVITELFDVTEKQTKVGLNHPGPYFQFRRAFSGNHLSLFKTKKLKSKKIECVRVKNILGGGCPGAPTILEPTHTSVKQQARSKPWDRCCCNMACAKQYQFCPDHF